MTTADWPEGLPPSTPGADALRACEQGAAIMAAAAEDGLRDRMANGYVAAALFALDKYGDACAEVDRQQGRWFMDGLSAAYGRAVLSREHWQHEANRCEILALLVSEVQ